MQWTRWNARIAAAIIALVVIAACLGYCRVPAGADPEPPTATPPSAAVNAPLLGGVPAMMPSTPIAAMQPIPTATCTPPPTPVGGGFDPRACPPPTPIPNTPNLGIPAIPVQTVSTDPAVPSFTADDARRYVEAHPYTGGRIQSVDTPMVTGVQFLTAAQADATYRVNFADEPSRLLCIVELSGTFALHGVPPAGNVTPKPAPIVQGSVLLIFDAHTGNRLGLAGVRERMGA